MDGGGRGVGWGGQFFLSKDGSVTKSGEVGRGGDCGLAEMYSFKLVVFLV